MEKQANQSAPFPPTHWTMIYRAAQPEKTAGREALGQLLEEYRGPLLIHLNWKFPAFHEQTEDWLHSFIEKKILENELLRSADEKRGRFRTFLRAALDNFVKDMLRHARREKRTPPGGVVPISALETHEEPVAQESGSDPSDAAWARKVISLAVARLREFYLAKGRQDTWGVFHEGFELPILNGTDPPSMSALANRFGFDSDSHASNALGNAKRMFKQFLGDVVRVYAEDEDAIEAEILELIAILSGAR